MIQYFAPDIETTLSLPEEDARHCLRVLRHREGDIVTVTDGRGGRYACRLLSSDPRSGAPVEIVGREMIDRPWPTKITVAVAPTKNADRTEWLVEKLTEVGVDRIVPLLTARSERKSVNVDRLVRIAVSAMKQSLKATLPEIMPLTPIAEFIDAVDDEGRFVAYCDETLPRILLSQAYRPLSGSVALLIGPEGDFTQDEVDMALAHNFVPVSLGPCRLRTETAALSGCETFHIINMLHQKQNA